MKIRVIVQLIAILIVSGCGYSKLKAPVHEVNIEPGISTKSHVYKLLGQPHDVISAPDETTIIWAYYDGDMTVDATNYIPFLSLIIGGPTIDYEYFEFTFDRESQLLTDRSERKDKVHVSNWTDSEQMAQIGLATDRVKHEMDLLGYEFDPDLAKMAEKYDVLLHDEIK